MRAAFEEYTKRYAYFAACRREAGILEIRLHRDGGAARFDGPMHADLGELFADAGADRDNRIIILTATGDRFLHYKDMDMSVMEKFLPYTAAMHLPLMPESIRLLEAYLNIEVPVISAVNGPCSIHAEIPAAADIVLAAEEAYFSDAFHFVNGVVPGDGVQVIWPRLLGRNRGHYFLLTGQRISSAEAHRIGFVNEVLPAARLNERAWQIARELARQPDVTLRATRMLMTRDLKRALVEDLPMGLALEGLGSSNHWPLKLRDV